MRFFFDLLAWFVGNAAGQVEKQRLEVVRLQGEQRTAQAEAAARHADKQRADAEGREARRLKTMEEMVERLQFENQRAADMFHDQVGKDWV
jgi:ABC-type phosphate transport system auxiliary subunit